MAYNKHNIIFYIESVRIIYKNGVKGKYAQTHGNGY